MSLLHSLWAIACLIFAINVPFGFWRASERKLSARWFLAIHAPVALSIGLRILVGVPLRLSSLPVFAGAFFFGQALGGKLRNRRAANS